jgi:HEAT repeat protein
LDVLRAVGNRAPSFSPESLRAIERLSAPRSSFRLRYLGVGPLSELARVSPRAHASLERALVADPDPRVRAAAAHAIRDAKPFQMSLVRALTDDAVRVRLGAVQALATAPNGPATVALLARLDTDPWPSVRALSAGALSGAARSPQIDKRLAGAVGDDAWLVRRAALEALGARGATAHGALVHERLDDDEEWPAVRRTAAAALGELCFMPALESLTTHVRRLSDPYATAEQRSIAFAALGALRTLAPRDLSTRLRPLLAQKAPAGARAAAKAALSEQSSHCRPRR